jgi:hypothetical protein
MGMGLVGVERERIAVPIGKFLLRKVAQRRPATCLAVFPAASRTKSCAPASAS